MEQVAGMDVAEARAFADAWLPAWSGGDAEWLLAFYAPDARYVDPAVPDGIQGTAGLRLYFTRLLARYPDWVWTQSRSEPLRSGFVNYWHAHVPVAKGPPVELDGVCLVELRDLLIVRNEVYFDRSALLAAEAR